MRAYLKPGANALCSGGDLGDPCEGAYGQRRSPIGDSFRLRLQTRGRLQGRSAPLACPHRPHVALCRGDGKQSDFGRPGTFVNACQLRWPPPAAQLREERARSRKGITFLFPKMPLPNTILTLLAETTGVRGWRSTHWRPAPRDKNRPASGQHLWQCRRQGAVAAVELVSSRQSWSAHFEVLRFGCKPPRAAGRVSP